MKTTDLINYVTWFQTMQKNTLDRRSLKDLKNFTISAVCFFTTKKMI